MSDVGNAYLNVRTQEKVNTITAEELGKYLNRVAAIASALYSLKSSGASW
jgi:hypothetical protein